jgi:hypothetical protein
MLNIMMLTSLDVEVPPSDVRDGRALPGLETGSERWRRAVRIKYSDGKGRPDNAQVAVRYRSGWFLDRRPRLGIQAHVWSGPAAVHAGGNGGARELAAGYDPRSLSRFV